MTVAKEPATPWSWRFATKCKMQLYFASHTQLSRNRQESVCPVDRRRIEPLWASRGETVSRECNPRSGGFTLNNQSSDITQRYSPQVLHSTSTPHKAESHEQLRSCVWQSAAKKWLPGLRPGPVPTIAWETGPTLRPAARCCRAGSRGAV